MGVIKRGILGGFSNKVANVVGSSWKGIAVIKSLPLSVANPNTVPQQVARTTFAQVSEAGSKLLANVIKPLWDRYAMQMSGYNAWVRRNIQYFSPSGLSVVNALVISEGTYGTAVMTNLTADASNGEAYVSWDTSTAGGNATSTDEVFIAIFNTTTGQYAGSVRGFERQDGYALVPCVGLVAGQTIEAYLATQDPTQRYNSNTTRRTALISA